MRVDLIPAYILHSRPYRETSLLLEALSRSHGRIGLVARGARGKRSKWKNMLQPFRPLLLSWNQRGELGTLTGADQVAAPPALRGDCLFCGLYCNELLMQFLQRADPHPGLFEHYGQLLAELAASEAPQARLRRFELHLLEAAGFGLQLDREAGGGRPVAADAWYEYVPESGPVRLGPDAATADRRISGAALLALQSGDIDAEHLPQLKRLMRGLIRHYLGGRKLKSQSLFM